jgi:hypothetical protein
MKKKIMFSFSLNFGQKIIIKEYIYIYISFILGVRAALFALLVHGVTLSLQLRKIYHLLSTPFALFLSWVIVIFITNKFKKIIFLKTINFI